MSPHTVHNVLRHLKQFAELGMVLVCLWVFLTMVEHFVEDYLL
jgi:hypothetical protein